MLEEIDIHDGLIDEWYEIAAYTPENWRVTHTDEIVQRVRFDRPFSLVGITANTAAARMLPAAQSAADSPLKGFRASLPSIRGTGR